MDPFTGPKPNLISKRTIRDFETQINQPFDKDEPKILDGIGSFYSNYVQPNMFPLIVISLLIIYITIKYILKKDREEREEKDKEKEDVRDNIKHMMIKDTNLDDNDEDFFYDKKTEISDIISDDYLITDSDEDDNEEDETQGGQEEYGENMYDSHGNIATIPAGYDFFRLQDDNHVLDRGADLVFGKTTN